MLFGVHLRHTAQEFRVGGTAVNGKTKYGWEIINGIKFVLVNLVLNNITPTTFSDFFFYIQIKLYVASTKPIQCMLSILKIIQRLGLVIIGEVHISKFEIVNSIIDDNQFSIVSS